MTGLWAQAEHRLGVIRIRQRRSVFQLRARKDVLHFCKTNGRVAFSKKSLVMVAAQKKLAYGEPRGTAQIQLAEVEQEVHERMRRWAVAARFSGGIQNRLNPNQRGGGATISTRLRKRSWYVKP